MHTARTCLLAILLAAALWMSGCQVILPQPVDTATPTATQTPTRAPSATPEPTPDGWEQLQPGLERRTLDVRQDGQYLDSLYILRLEPQYFHFQVAYDPQGLTLENWQTQSGALVVINGGFFRLENETYIPTGLTIIDGVPMGTSYGDFGGMLAISGGVPELRWLAQQPYEPNEPLQSALQSFPILVKPGGELGFGPEHEDNIQARRSLIAQDQAGRMLLMVAPQGNLTLHQLSAFLTDTDLGIDIAINLDGGPSSGILLAQPVEVIPALSPLPIVITVHKR
ncbi:MAG: phosphodiester glycosidase family protein [Anaerolineales bacterium]